MDIEKPIKSYSKRYRKSLSSLNVSDIESQVVSYEEKLSNMYNSEEFKKYNQYPTVDTVKVFAVIAMCLGLKELNLSDSKIIDTINNGFSTTRKFIKILMGCIDCLPSTWKIAKKWNLSDHDQRLKDGSVVYDYFNVEDNKIEYHISKCIYVEMFEVYGIRSLCKIFCMTDTTSYEYLSRHIKLFRYSDLSDGSCCYDEIINKK